jgi:Zn-dependent peptidase ImmA (M78 family)
VVCRSSLAKDPIEWQADYFSACLLMPREMVLDAWEKHRGSAAPVVCTEDYLRKLEEISGPRSTDQLAADLFDNHAGELAPIFQVSTQAMRIRMEELRLLQRGNGLSLGLGDVA